MKLLMTALALVFLLSGPLTASASQDYSTPIQCHGWDDENSHEFVFEFNRTAQDEFTGTDALAHSVRIKNWHAFSAKDFFVRSVPDVSSPCSLKGDSIYCDVDASGNGGDMWTVTINPKTGRASGKFFSQGGFFSQNIEAQFSEDQLNCTFR